MMCVPKWQHTPVSQVSPSTLVFFFYSICACISAILFWTQQPLSDPKKGETWYVEHYIHFSNWIDGLISGLFIIYI